MTGIASLLSCITNIIGSILPNARNDAFTLTEGQALALSGDQIKLDVMANDSGLGKSLYSVDNGDCIFDLLRKDAQYSFESTALGASITITNGKITYNFASLETAINALAADQTLVDSFTYAIRAAGVLLDAATVTMTFVGENDGTNIFIGAGDLGAASLSATDATGAGTLSVVDVDTADTVAAVVASVAATGNAGTLDDAALLNLFSITPALLDADAGSSGNLAWNFDASGIDLAYLAEDESLTLAYTVAVSDGHGGNDAETVTITLAGVNDGPVITLAATDASSAALTEANADFAATGTLTVTDADISDTVSATITGVTVDGPVASNVDMAALLAMLTLTPATLAADNGDASNLTWSFAAPAAAFDYLDGGETLTLTYTVAVADGHGGVAEQTVSVAIAGVDDLPGGNDTLILPETYDGADPNDFDTLFSPDGINGTSGDDVISGGLGIQTINGLDGNDTINGGLAADIIFGGNGDDTLSGAAGADLIYGQPGDDNISGGNEPDRLYGGSGEDIINGNGQSDVALYGGSGNDTLIGNLGSDTIIGGYGADLIIGRRDGNGDVYRYLDVRDTNDTIQNFKVEDTFDMSAMDADSVAAGKQDFVFAGTTATAHALWQVVNGADSYLYADTDGDLDTVEFMVTLEGWSDPLAQIDFIL